MVFTWVGELRNRIDILGRTWRWLQGPKVLRKQLRPLVQGRYFPGMEPIEQQHYGSVPEDPRASVRTLGDVRQAGELNSAGRAPR